MATFDIAYEWLMGFEDPNRQYKVMIDNNGAGVVSGVNAKSFPQAFSYIQAIPQAERGPAVANFYHQNFWNRWYEALISDDLAKRVLDMGVNGGPSTTVRLLQHAIVECGGLGLTIDGTWGNNTLTEANACDEYELVSAFKGVRSQYYRDIVDRHPEDLLYLNGWLERAEK